MFQALHTKRYASCGIETSWRACKGLFEEHPRVLYSDDMCGRLWDMCLATVVQHCGRNLIFTHGLPRRQTLLCDPDPLVSQSFVGEFRQDCANWESLQSLEFDWADTCKKRSVFQKRAVQQLRGCLEMEDWQVTSRHPARTTPPCATIASIERVRLVVAAPTAQL